MSTAVLWLAVFVAVIAGCIAGAFRIESRRDARRRTLARAPSHPAALALQPAWVEPLRPLTPAEEQELADVEWDRVMDIVSGGGDDRG